MTDILVSRPDLLSNGLPVVLRYHDNGDGTYSEVTSPNSSGVDLTASGNITIQNSVPAGVATAGSAVQIATAGQSTIGFIVSGTYTGALSLQLSQDGLTWVTAGGTPLIAEATGIPQATVASAAVGGYQADVSGYAFARLTALAAVTGTATLAIRATPANAVVSLSSSLPAGSATIGGVNIIALPTPTVFTLTSAATTNATSVKGTAGSLFEISADNETAALKYLKLYNKATAPTVGTDVPILTIPIPINGSIQVPFGAIGKRFSTGIAYAITNLQAVADTTAVAAGDVHVSGSYI